MADLKAFAEQLVNLTVKEVSELATILKEEYGIEPAAAAVAVAGPAAGGPAAGACRACMEHGRSLTVCNALLLRKKPSFVHSCQKNKNAFGINREKRILRDG